MTERVLGPKESPRRRWTLLVALTAALAFGLMYVAGAQAVHDDGLFELDKNATNNLNTTKIGVLQANISATDSPIVICETATFNGAPAGTPRGDAGRGFRVPARGTLRGRSRSGSAGGRARSGGARRGLRDGLMTAAGVMRRRA